MCFLFCLKVSYCPPISFCLANSYSSFKIRSKYVDAGASHHPHWCSPPLLLWHHQRSCLLLHTKENFLRRGTLSPTFISRTPCTENQQVTLLVSTSKIQLLCLYGKKSNVMLSVWTRVRQLRLICPSDTNWRKVLWISFLTQLLG